MGIRSVENSTCSMHAGVFGECAASGKNIENPAIDRK